MALVCCEHNRCPQRPTWWLGRFQTRPWLCPQCKRIWCTEQNYDGWGDTAGWEWIEIPIKDYAEGMSRTATKEKD